MGSPRRCVGEHRGNTSCFGAAQGAVAVMQPFDYPDPNQIGKSISGGSRTASLAIPDLSAVSTLAFRSAGNKAGAALVFVG